MLVDNLYGMFQFYLVIGDQLVVNGYQVYIWRIVKTTFS